MADLDSGAIDHDETPAPVVEDRFQVGALVAEAGHIVNVQVNGNQPPLVAGQWRIRSPSAT